MSNEHEPRRIVGSGTIGMERTRDSGGRMGPQGAGDTAAADAVWTVIEGRWLIAAAVATALVIVGAYLLVATPRYQANVLLQVREDTTRPEAHEDLSTVLGEKTATETEMEIMRSRKVVSAVVDQLALDIQASPRRFPIIGRVAARWNRGRGPAAAVFGLARFAWGGERIRVDRLTVSDSLVDEPLVLTALGDGRYRLATEGGEALTTGVVGNPATASAGAGRIELLVSELVARPGTEIVVKKLRRADVVDRLQEALRISESAKKTGMVVMALAHPDPVKAATILDAIAAAYLRENADRKSSDAEKTLQFIGSQLPVVKASVENAEAALNAFQQRRGTVDLSAETKAIVDRSVGIEKAISELELTRADLRQRYTANHPALITVEDKIEKLRTEQSAINSRMRVLPDTELDSARLTRDVKVATELYLLLLKKAQELDIVKSGGIANVRVVDSAVVPRKPASPKPIPLALIAAIAGLAGGVALVFVRERLHDGIEDPEDVEVCTGLPVLGVVAHSKKESGRAGYRRQPRVDPLSALDPGDAAVESLRSLRTSLQFALSQSRNNVVAIASPSPGVGKSFVCVNLAHLLAAAERRVLVIDGDLRRGGLHRYFGLEPQPGLSDVLGGTALESAIRRTDTTRLDMLAAGHIPPNPAELLASQRFRQVLADAAGKYDVVLVDTPPVLAVTDSSLVACHAGITLLVLRAGEHPPREVALAVKRFAHHGVSVRGAILNDVRAARRRYGKYGRYRQYEYRTAASV